MLLTVATCITAVGSVRADGTKPDVRGTTPFSLDGIKVGDDLRKVAGRKAYVRCAHDGRGEFYGIACPDPTVADEGSPMDGTFVLLVSRHAVSSAAPMDFMLWLDDYFADHAGFPARIGDTLPNVSQRFGPPLKTRRLSDLDGYTVFVASYPSGLSVLFDGARAVGFALGTIPTERGWDIPAIIAQTTGRVPNQNALAFDVAHNGDNPPKDPDTPNHLEDRGAALLGAACREISEDDDGFEVALNIGLVAAAAVKVLDQPSLIFELADDSWFRQGLIEWHSARDGEQTTRVTFTTEMQSRRPASTRLELAQLTAALQLRLLEERQVDRPSLSELCLRSGLPRPKQPPRGVFRDEEEMREGNAFIARLERLAKESGPGRELKFQLTTPDGATCELIANVVAPRNPGKSTTVTSLTVQPAAKLPAPRE